MDVCGLRCHVYHRGPWNVWRMVHSRPNLTWLITELWVVASEVTPAPSAPRDSCKCRSEMQAKSLSNLALIYCWPQPISLCLSKENLTQGVRKFAKSSSVLSHFILTTTLGSVGFITPFYVNLTKVITNKRWSLDSDPGVCLNPYPLSTSTASCSSPNVREDRRGERWWSQEHHCS